MGKACDENATNTRSGSFHKSEKGVSHFKIISATFLKQKHPNFLTNNKVVKKDIMSRYGMMA